MNQFNQSETAKGNILKMCCDRRGQFASGRDISRKWINYDLNGYIRICVAI